MMEKPNRADIDSHRVILEIARLLNGMPINQVHHILKVSGELVTASANVNVDAPAFQEQVTAFNEVFGADVTVTSKAAN